MKKTKILVLCECALLLALSIVLSFVEIYKMPMGGGITLVSMLPVLLVGVRHGVRHGLATSTTFALFQLLQAAISGNVFPYCTVWQTVVACVLFDYAVPFSLLGLSGLAKIKSGEIKRGAISAVFAVLISVRFVCHYITGVAIWGQWAPEGMGKYLYSLIYNGQYMLPELILTLVAANVLLSLPQMKRMLTK